MRGCNNLRGIYVHWLDSSGSRRCEEWRVFTFDHLINEGNTLRYRSSRTQQSFCTEVFPSRPIAICIFINRRIHISFIISHNHCRNQQGPFLTSISFPFGFRSCHKSKLSDFHSKTIISAFVYWGVVLILRIIIIPVAPLSSASFSTFTSSSSSSCLLVSRQSLTCHSQNPRKFNQTCKKEEVTSLSLCLEIIQAKRDSKVFVKAYYQILRTLGPSKSATRSKFTILYPVPSKTSSYSATLTHDNRYEEVSCTLVLLFEPWYSFTTCLSCWSWVPHHPKPHHRILSHKTAKNHSSHVPVVCTK